MVADGLERPFLRNLLTRQNVTSWQTSGKNIYTIATKSHVIVVREMSRVLGVGDKVGTGNMC